ncbi:methylenetetrahydrofolate reductase [Brucella oryzae]|uniref:methylenetetrahydrofolate reductase n=1 Tax=Brucella oryzae TaxID=335286 RepID=UPI001B81F3AF|nr:methylenetetrahydrofolate reductase [Brucella oryzae]MBR7653399.1 methylenetetrahydrofolate reductase [Brucella oryzae]
MEIDTSSSRLKHPMKASLRAYALEITGKAIGEVDLARRDIPPQTPINVAFLGNESHEQRINAANVIRSYGFEPVPIISSRRLRSELDRDQLLGALVAEASPQRFIFVGGDPSEPAGPFQDSIALLKSGVLDRYSIRHVGIVAYPEGHPKIDDEALWNSLRWKIRFLSEAGCSIEITTQFGFDTAAAVRWIKKLRDEGIEAPVRIGVPGPSDIGKLLRFAKQFGVVTSVALARRYGLSLTNLARKAVADRYWTDLSENLAGQQFGDVRFHLYPFGGMLEGVRWMNDRLEAASGTGRGD